MSSNLLLACVLLLGFTQSISIADAAPRTGYILIDSASGKHLATRSAQSLFTPASTLKLVTALSALDHLGPDHRFETSLSITGTLHDNTLDGDVVLRGQGDVELDLDDLMSMSLSLRQSGIHRVNGRFIVSDDLLLRVEQINPKQPEDAPYNAGVGALSLAYGRVTMRRDVNGNPFANPDIPPENPAWRLVNDTQGGQSRAIPIRDVGMHTAHSLRKKASRLDVDLPIPRRGSAQAPVRRLSTIKSKPLAEMIEGMMVYSNNQLAETIGLATANALALKPRSLAESVSELWSDLLPRLPDTQWQGFRITNHSGLDPDARASPLHLAALLQYGLERHALPHMLPANAWSGSLSRRLVEPGHLQRIWAKTGSIDFATALAGYLLPESGGLWIFAILTDDLEKRALYDDMPEPDTAIRAEARRWESDVRLQHDQLLRQWISGEF